MNTILDQISAVMRVKQYFPPADPNAIEEVERELGVSFPTWLRQLYLAADGFVGPTGVRYLYRLKERDGILGITQDLRRGWDQAEWLKRAIVFADNGLGGTLTVHWAVLDEQLVEWCYGDEAEYQVLPTDIYNVWAREQRAYDEAEAAL